METVTAALAAVSLAALAQSPGDLRAGYDVQAYRLELRVDPEAQRIEGRVTVEAIVTAEELTAFELDLKSGLEVADVAELGGPADAGSDGLRAVGHMNSIEFSHTGDRLRCETAPHRRGERIAVTVEYSGSPRALNDFDGFHWAQTADGRPWISTSCQSPGARSWWPCKDSTYHPEDKPELVEVVLTVPVGLYGVSNGRLVSRAVEGELERFHWRHEYPLETYSVTLNVAPYEVVATELKLDGIEGKVPFVYYVLPENLEKAKLQFADVPGMLEVYGRAFGPFPFPKSKYALVETSFWGMEHSTAVAYGSSYPAWCKREGERDPYAGRNQLFDYILVHESAHEWWGNAVSAADWGDFWIHEGLATYSEAVYVEHTRDRAAADQYLEGIRLMVPDKGSLYRGKGVDSEQAYGIIVYYKGAWVLHTLRHYLDDDDAWWRTLRAFQLAHRYGNATTEDFRAVIEKESGRSWKRFFDEWFHGRGYPRLEGEVQVGERGLRIAITNTGSDGTGFHVPLDLTWTEKGERVHRRVELAPGANELTIECADEPSEVEIENLGRVLGRHEVAVREGAGTWR